MVVPRERDVEETAQDLRTLAAEAGLEGAVLALPGPGPPALPRACPATPTPRLAGRRRCSQRRAAPGPCVASPAGLLRPSLAPHLLETRVRAACARATR